MANKGVFVEAEGKIVECVSRRLIYELCTGAKMMGLSSKLLRW